MSDYRLQQLKAIRVNNYTLCQELSIEQLTQLDILSKTVIAAYESFEVASKLHCHTLILDCPNCPEISLKMALNGLNRSIHNALLSKAIQKEIFPKINEVKK